MVSDTTFNLAINVQPFTADAEQRGDRLLYRHDEHTMNYYYYHRWLVSPEDMLTDIVAVTLTRWGLFGKGVYQRETGVIPTHEIHGRLVDMYAVNIRKQQRAVFVIKITVLRISPENFTKMPVFQKTYQITHPRNNGGVESYVSALNDTVEEWLMLLQYDLEAVMLEEAKVFNKYQEEPFYLDK